jgi:RimJ/RimL family protein N-acetyltransferase
VADTPTHEHRPIINILGDRVALGPPRRDLLPTYERWMNDFDTLYLAGYIPGPRTLEGLSASYDRWTNDDKHVRFDIYEVATWRPIGFVLLKDIDFNSRTAEFGIAIAEADCRGKGYGTEATRLLLDFAFTARNLHSVSLTTAEFNVAGQRAYEKAGFRVFGRQRQCWMAGGRLWDIIHMECLATEFESPVLRQVFGLDAPGQPD